MKFCQPHWDKLRAAIEARGLTPLVSVGGASAVEKTVEQLKTGRETLDNYDPLMAAHWAIAGNLMRLLGPSALYLMSGGDEDPMEVEKIAEPALREKYAGKTWPRCPICYANVAHELSCREENCQLTRVDGYEWVVDRAADDAKERVDELMRAGRQT